MDRECKVSKVLWSSAKGAGGAAVGRIAVADVAMHSDACPGEICAEVGTDGSGTERDGGILRQRRDVARGQRGEDHVVKSDCRDIAGVVPLNLNVAGCQDMNVVVADVGEMRILSAGDACSRTAR